MITLIEKYTRKGFNQYAPMQDLKITIIQTDIIWEQIDSNIRKFDTLIDSINSATDLIILPEMFTTGFSMNAGNLFQDIDGSAVTWLKKKSKEINADIAGSIIFGEKGGYYNRLLWVKPDGSIFFYDKKHLFRHAGEEKIYTPGISKITITLNDWKIRPFICYDLRFPLWTRNINNEYDAAIFTANWPEARSAHWKALLHARAIENQCYVIGVNRVGYDGNNNQYSGDSSIVNYKGDILYQKSKEESVHTMTLSFSGLSEYRKVFPVWKDADFDLIN